VVDHSSFSSVGSLFRARGAATGSPVIDFLTDMQHVEVDMCKVQWDF